MIPFVTALLQDVTHHLTHKTPLPAAFAALSKQMDLLELQKGVWELLQLDSVSKEPQSDLAKATATYLCTDVASAFDHQDAKPVQDMPHTALYLESLQSWNTRKQEAILRGIISKLLHGAPLIVVETALPLEVSQKTMFRTDLIAQYGTCFPMFRTNSSLLGGVRLYINGTLTEYSLRAEIDAIFTHLYLNV